MENWSHQILKDAHVCCYQQYLNILYLLKTFLFLPRNFLLPDYIQKHWDANLYDLGVCLFFFLLSMMLISSCKRWFVKWETVRASFPLSVRMVGVDNQTSQSGLISLAMNFKFKSCDGCEELSWLEIQEVCDGAYYPRLTQENVVLSHCDLFLITFPPLSRLLLNHQL